MSPHQSHFTTGLLHRAVSSRWQLIRSAPIAVAVVVVVMLALSLAAVSSSIIAGGGLLIGGDSRNMRMMLRHSPMLDYFRQGHQQHQEGRRVLLSEQKLSGNSNKRPAASRVTSPTKRPTTATAQQALNAASKGDFGEASDAIVDTIGTASVTAACTAATGGTGVSFCPILAQVFGPLLKNFLDIEGVMGWFTSDDVEMIVQASPIHGAGGDALWAYYKSGDWNWSDDSHLQDIRRGENKAVHEDLTGHLLNTIELRAERSDEVCVEYVAWIIGRGASHTGLKEVVALSAADLNSLVDNEANFGSRAGGCVWFGKADRGDIKSVKFSWSSALWCIENSNEQLVDCMKKYAIEHAEVTTGFEQADDGWFGGWWGK